MHNMYNFITTHNWNALVLTFRNKFDDYYVILLCFVQFCCLQDINLCCTSTVTFYKQIVLLVLIIVLLTTWLLERNTTA